MTRVDEPIVEVFPYALPLRTPYRWAKGVQTHRNGALVRVSVAGVEGWGEAAPAPDEQPENPDTYARDIRRVLDEGSVGEDAFESITTPDVSASVRCGITTAWLSFAAARAGLSFAQWLAGTGTPARTIPVNGLITEASPMDALRRARECYENGMRTVKVKCTADWDEDLQRIAAIRHGLPGISLRLDPNESWTFEEAVDRLRGLSPTAIDYVEQPLPVSQPLEAFAELRERTPIRIALDQTIVDVRTAKRAIELGAADVFVLKAQTVGGYDVMQRIVAAASSAGVECTITASMESAVGVSAAVQFAATVPRPIAPAGVSTGRFFARDVASMPTVVDGQIEVPTERGIGLADVAP